MKFLKRNYWLIITFFTVVLDQISKIIIEELIPLNDTIVVIQSFFSLHHTKNDGAAFGMLSGHRWVFMIFTVLIIVIAVYMICSKKIKNVWGITALSFIIGGGIGNMIDRILEGEVTDFFAFTFWGFDFAVFNVADIFVCCGTFVLAFYIFFTKDFDTEEKAEESIKNEDA